VVAEGSACPHCRETATLHLDGERAWCAACGGTILATGEAEEICPDCTLMHAPNRPRWRRCPGAPARPATESVPDVEWLEAIRSRCGVVSLGRAGAYLAGVRATVDDAPGGPPPLMAEDAEPFMLTLPGGTLLASRGLLAALEDEAQLAFLLAREASLVRRDRVERRYSAAAVASRSALWPFLRRVDEAGLVDAVEVSRTVGFGPESEHLADRDALAAMVNADYDPQAGARALTLLGAASRESGRYRVSRVRSRLLGRWLIEVGRPAVARINREVFARATRSLRQLPS